MSLVTLELINNPNTYGFIAATLTTAAFFPQLIKTWQTKQANDVSILMLIMFITGISFWAFYGWKTHALPVLIANILTLLLNLSILILKIVFSKDTDDKSFI